MSIKKYLLFATLISAPLLLVLFNTRPDTAPLYVLIIPFSCIFALVSLTVYSAFRIIGKKDHSVLLTSVSLFAGAVTALGLGLNSVGSLLPREIAIVLIFFSLLMFYAFKRRK